MLRFVLIFFLLLYITANVLLGLYLYWRGLRSLLTEARGAWQGRDALETPGEP